MAKEVLNVLKLGTDELDFAASAGYEGKLFHELADADQETVLRKLWESPGFPGQLVLLWFRVCWLVIYSRDAARSQIHFKMPPPDPIVDVPRPTADLTKSYDFCVVGSGAGGSLFAYQAAAAGKEVLLIEEGPFVPPSEYPTSDWRALAHLYRDGGVQPGLDENLPHFPVMTVLQARLVGGGPAVNNAIHFPIHQKTFQDIWVKEEDFLLNDWKEMQDALDQVHKDLGVNTGWVAAAAGWRSRAFQGAATPTPDPFDLAVENCIGCGGCNTGCRFGHKTGGLHPYRPGGTRKNSYLMRFLDKTGNDGLAFGLRAERLWVNDAGDTAETLICSKADGKRIQISAKNFVAAAGPIGSSILLRKSAIGPPGEVGRRMSANVVLPIFADVPTPPTGFPDPGIAMCYFVNQDQNNDGRLLETWFHYPGSLAAIFPNWITDHVAIMNRYSNLASCGSVVPSANHGYLSNSLVNDPPDRLSLTLNKAELKQMVDGAVQIANVYRKAGASTVYPGTARPCRIDKDTFDKDVDAFRKQVESHTDLALSSSHIQGGNAMAKNGVVGSDFRVNGMTNVFVADGSLFPAGCRRNPQMTIMALATLAAKRALR
jgi:choline dehydrogenase-like flavoprotein